MLRLAALRWRGSAPSSWAWGHRGFGSSGSNSDAAAAPGLFGIPRLQKPEDFVTWSREAVENCNQLIGRVMEAPHDASVIQLMDDISDTMCQVCDAAEACRNVHADTAWRNAAGTACAGLSSYLAEINQHEGMYRKLRDTMERWRRSKEASTSGRGPEGSSGGGGGGGGGGGALALMSPAELAGFDPETSLVGWKLQVDHEKSGVHLVDAGRRGRLRKMMELGQHYPSAFNAALSNPRQLGVANIPADLLPPTWRVLARNGRLPLPLDGPNLHSFLTGVGNEEARRQAYIAGHSTPAKNVELLESMIACRSEMAALLGFPSYAHLKAADATLAGAPEAATAFLEQLAEGVRPLADAEAELLRRVKARDTQDPGAALRAWDLDYATTQARSLGGAVRPDAATPYLQLDSVLSGLSTLLAQTFGVELRPEPLRDGGPEAWAPGLRRLGVFGADGGERLGTLYLDLLARPGKLPGSVLFPIRCGRRLPDGSYQQPILALVTPCGPSPDRPAFTWRELRTFVHEMGHAVHNMVSRTRYQHLWGTRCAQDVVEIPSHLAEHFVTDHRTAALIARHSGSGDPIPPKLHGALLASHGAFPALELQQQVLLAMVDLAYFGTPLDPSRPTTPDTSAVWHDLAAKHSSVPPVPGTCTQARFSHLTIYGATYYSYLYARGLAEAVWRRHLAADPLDPAAGREVRRLLLEPGGAVEPLDLVSATLGGRQHLQQHAASGGWSPRPDALLASLVETARGQAAGAGAAAAAAAAARAA